MTTPNDTLESLYADAQVGNQQIFAPEIVRDIETILARISKNKSIVSALVTSLLKKILTPTQDIRLHRENFEGGYSARSLDTKVTSPFFKRRFPRYANKESAFLTLPLRAEIEWTQEKGVNLKTHNVAVRTAFLNILHNVQSARFAPQDYLLCLFQKLIQLSKQEAKIFEQTYQATAVTADSLNINSILAILKQHFAMKNGSRLPVIAIYTIYQDLMRVSLRFKDKALQPLNVHTSPDRRSYGDIEIYDDRGQPFEVIEIKHGIALNRYLVSDAFRKARDTNIKRYYVLTTREPNFAEASEETSVSELTLKIKHQTNLEIIANGIMPSLKYYLRFVEDYQDFLTRYAQNLVDDARTSTEVTVDHLERWNAIIKQHGGADDEVG